MHESEKVTVRIPLHGSHFFLKPVEHKIVLESRDEPKCLAMLQSVLQDQECARGNEDTLCCTLTEGVPVRM